GFYKNKSAYLREFTKWFISTDTKNIATKTLREIILNLKGIGPETADTILLYALHRTSFVIDSYTRRIFGRLGYDTDVTYERLQNTFMSSLPADVELYDRYHGLIVEHAKRHCNKQPICDGCPVRSLCKVPIE
ncbi:MAG: hypothetical protein Q8865_08405, partial [Bacillota bacterium]|nr:hypothetical protein [Bacillota bacterium]